MLIRVRAAYDLGRMTPKGWYWTGLGQNSGGKLVKTAEAAKAFKDNRAKLASQV